MRFECAGCNAEYAEAVDLNPLTKRDALLREMATMANDAEWLDLATSRHREREGCSMPAFTFNYFAHGWDEAS